MSRWAAKKRKKGWGSGNRVEAVHASGQAKSRLHQYSDGRFIRQVT